MIRTAATPTVSGTVSDADLTRAAMAADPDAPIPDDAIPFLADRPGDLLPEWYMPAPRGFRRTPARRAVVVAIIVSLVAVNGAGLCVTSGWPEIAW